MSKSFILIVDDYKMNYEVIKHYLYDFDIFPIWASNGEEALQILESDYNIKLIIMDYMMPVMNGIEATEKIKKITPEIPVILYSVYNECDILEQFKLAGCSYILQKPIDRNNFNKIINQYLSN